MTLNVPASADAEPIRPANAAENRLDRRKSLIAGLYPLASPVRLTATFCPANTWNVSSPTACPKIRQRSVARHRRVDEFRPGGDATFQVVNIAEAFFDQLQARLLAAYAVVAMKCHRLTAIEAE